MADALMFSVVIVNRRRDRGLSHLMAQLVPGAVEGVVRQVLVVDPRPSPEVSALCEDAGAMLVVGDLEAGIRAARHDHILILPGHIVLRSDWMARLAAFSTARRKPHWLWGQGGLVWLGPRGLATLRDGFRPGRIRF